MGLFKVRTLGVSNYEVDDLLELLEYSKVKPSVVQNKLDPFNPGSISVEGATDQISVLKFCQGHSIQFVAYSVLSAWPYELSALNNPHVQAVASLMKKTPAQVLVRWALQSGAAVVVKSQTPDNIIQNGRVFDFELSDEHMRYINGLSWMTHMLPPDFIHNSHSLDISETLDLEDDFEDDL